MNKFGVAITALAAVFIAVAADEGPQPLASVRWHVRAAASPATAGTLTASWNDGRARITVDVPAIADDDPLTGATAHFRYFIADSVARQGDITLAYTDARPAVSIVIKADGGGAVAELGAAACSKTFDIVYDLEDPGAADAAVQGAELIRNDMTVRRRPAPQFSRFADVDSLIAAVRTSADPAEGCWRYLDRDMRPEKAVPGGFYTLATVADGNGGYEIVYLGGATQNAGAWQPLRLKGRLVPSGFAGNYDLAWQAADGRGCPPESYAVIDAYTGTLTLYFPLLGASMRFRKLR